MEFFGNLMHPIMVTLATWTGSFGIAIILLTLIIRFAMLPLSFKQLQSTARMRELQPKMTALRERYKDNPDQLNKRMLELYKENNFNPLAGCLPTLLQFPIFIGLFVVARDFPERLAQDEALSQTINLHLFGLDLSQADPTYILPILAAVTMGAQMYLMPGDPAQKRIFMFMPILFLWISFSFPAAVVLYWAVTNVFSLGQQVLIFGRLPKPEESDKKE